MVSKIWELLSAISVFPKQGCLRWKVGPMYAFHSESHRGYLARTKSPLPDDIEAYELIIEDFPDSMPFYYEKLGAGARNSMGQVARIPIYLER